MGRSAGRVWAPGVDERRRASLEYELFVANAKLECAFDAKDRFKTVVPMPGKVIAGLVAVQFVVPSRATKIVGTGGVEFLV